MSYYRPTDDVITDAWRYAHAAIDHCLIFIGQWSRLTNDPDKTPEEKARAQRWLTFYLRSYRGGLRRAAELEEEMDRRGIQRGE